MTDFQSSFSKTRYLEEVLASVSRYIASCGMLSGFCPSLSEYCSAVWCSASDTHFGLLGLVVSGTRFLTRGVFECDVAHRRYVAVRCKLYKTRCNPTHPLNGALPDLMCRCGLHAVVWSHIGIHMNRLAAEPRRTA